MPNVVFTWRAFFEQNGNCECLNAHYLLNMSIKIFYYKCLFLDRSFNSYANTITSLISKLDKRLTSWANFLKRGFRLKDPKQLSIESLSYFIVSIYTLNKYKLLNCKLQLFLLKFESLNFVETVISWHIFAEAFYTNLFLKWKVHDAKFLAQIKSIFQTK